MTEVQAWILLGMLLPVVAALGSIASSLALLGRRSGGSESIAAAIRFARRPENIAEAIRLAQAKPTPRQSEDA